jgi:hypothetical protein
MDTLTMANRGNAVSSVPSLRSPLEVLERLPRGGFLGWRS